MTKGKRMSADEAMAAGLNPFDGEFTPMVIPPKRAVVERIDDDEVPPEYDHWRNTEHTGTPIAMETLSDTGNAERWAKMHKADFRYLRETGEWLAWNGRRWDRSGAGLALLSTKEVARSFLIDAAVEQDDGRKKELIKHARESESANSRARMLTLGKAEPGIGVDVSQLDTNPWIINCQNGTVNLQTGNLNPFAQKDMCTRIAPVAYEPDALCPVFDAFLESSLPDPEVREWLMRFFGYCLTGVVREHIFPMLWGAVGRNGKGTLIETIFSIMGDLAAPMPNELIIETKNEQHATLKAQLLAVRLAVAAELKAGDRLNEAQVKLLTGGDSIRARFMRQDFFSFNATHKLVLQTNQKPRATADAALWARVRVVPFMVSFLGREDTELKAKLANEREGIFARLVRHCLAWNMHGLGQADAIDRATQDYQADSDTMGLFLSDTTARADTTESVSASALYDAYRHWCEGRGERPWTITSFGTAMVSRGLVRAETKRGRVYRGMRLRNAAGGGGGDYLSGTPMGGGVVSTTSNNSQHPQPPLKIDPPKEDSDEVDSYWRKWVEG